MIKLRSNVKPPHRVHIKRKAIFDAMKPGETLFEDGDAMNLKAYVSRYQSKSEGTFVTWMGEHEGVRGRFVQRTA